MNKYDVAIIGAGPCGYVAGIRAAQLGLKTCIFEKDGLGGVCLNRGCIPAKVLSMSSQLVNNIEHAGEFGIDIKEYDVNYIKICERKDKIVKKLAAGVEALLKARKIDIIREKAEIKDATHIATNNTVIETKNILIATGSVPFEIPDIPFEGKYILSSSHIFELRRLPRSMLIVGGGVIGCEFASIFRGLGSEITIVEMMEQLLPNEDEEIAGKLAQIFKKKGINIYTETKVERIDIDRKKDSVTAILSNGQNISVEKAVICVGRSPNSKNLGIEKTGIQTNKGGWIRVDEYFRTNLQNIYAAGDVKGGFLLAHVSSKEGIAVVENIAGNNVKINYNVVPICIYTSPEIGCVGLTERQAKKQGFNVKGRKFLFSAIGKAHIVGDIDGFIKLVVDVDSDKIIGARIIGPHATELVAEISLCIQYEITSEELARVVHAHPTLSEIVQEVSEAVHNRAIHSL